MSNSDTYDVGTCGNSKVSIVHPSPTPGLASLFTVTNTDTDFTIQFSAASVLDTYIGSHVIEY